MNIKLQSIARQNSAEPVMEELFAGDITIEDGLAGDCSPLTAAGEVSVLSKESWIKVCHEADVELPWLAHGANLFIKGFEFLPTDIGRTLRIGDALLEIHRDTGPGDWLETQAPALVEALRLGWRGGVICKVRAGGSVQTGDSVEILD